VTDVAVVAAPSTLNVSKAPVLGVVVVGVGAVGLPVLPPHATVNSAESNVRTA
jgi:hypothetical protein